jgi:hypothetical protein
MPFKHHPSEALLLSVLNGTASSAEQTRVSDHLAVCSRCRSVSERKRVLLRALNEFSGSSLPRKRNYEGASTLPFPKRKISKVSVFRFAGPAIAASFFIVILAWPRHIQTVSAAELLSRAETAEVNTETGRHFYRLHVGATACDTGDANWSEAAEAKVSPCTRFRNELHKTNWDDRQMMSARSYRKWHDALAKRRDSVLHQEPYWTLKTDTDQGLLRSASLRVRSSDYRPVELILEFAALQPVSVVEDSPSERHIYVPAAEPAQLAKSEYLQHVDEPADAIEVQAWKMLRSLGADSGWEATVTRRGGEVRIVGYVDEASRREKFEQAFSHLPDVTVDLNQPGALPKRGGNGDAQPLAERRLEALIPDAHERGKRITEISDASRAVVGKAYLHDCLVARRNVFQESPAAHGLSPLIEEERSDLLAAAIHLSDLLEPLIETRGNHGIRTSLSYSQARTLDAGVLSLVNAAPKQSASLEQTTNLVRSLLPKS